MFSSVYLVKLPLCEASSKPSRHGDHMGWQAEDPAGAKAWEQKEGRVLGKGEADHQTQLCKQGPEFGV